ncbi:MAG: class I SAM-dependent rRNA methyltransferase [Planctomycetota bacterium]
MSLPEVRLKIRVRGRHPWFFRKMVDKPRQPLPAGGIVRVVDRGGAFVGIGLYNARSELALRLFSHEPTEDVNARLALLLETAFDLRENTLGLASVSNAYRLAHSEGDGLPGLVLDLLGDWIVAQPFSLGMLKLMEHVEACAARRYPGKRLVLSVEEAAAEREGMGKIARVPARETEVVERGVRFRVLPASGHKTGFFADQRDNRQLVRNLARGRRVLDLFCHAGGFGIAAALGGAKAVLAVDLDEDAVAQARSNAALNKQRIDCRHADAFDVLREVKRGAFDLIVLDPPKWVAGKTQIGDGLVRYRDLNRIALEKCVPGALLVTCSCSGAVSEELFLATLREAAAAAARDARVLMIRGAGADHPVALECAETRYLKVVVLQVR